MSVAPKARGISVVNSLLSIQTSSRGSIATGQGGTLACPAGCSGSLLWPLP